MGFDLAESFGWIVAELAHERSIVESMDRLIDRCECARPHPDWARLRSLPYGDLWPLFEWLQIPFRDEPPSRPLRGLWFGLFNPRYDGPNPWPTFTSADPSDSTRAKIIATGQ